MKYNPVLSTYLVPASSHLIQKFEPTHAFGHWSFNYSWVSAPFGLVLHEFSWEVIELNKNCTCHTETFIGIGVAFTPVEEEKALN